MYVSTYWYWTHSFNLSLHKWRITLDPCDLYAVSPRRSGPGLGEVGLSLRHLMLLQGPVSPTRQQSCCTFKIYTQGNCLSQTRPASANRSASLQNNNSSTKEDLAWTWPIWGSAVYASDGQTGRWQWQNFWQITLPLSFMLQRSYTVA